VPLNDHTSSHLANLFSALSDPARLRILDLLLDDEFSVGAIAEKLNMSESAVSHQLRGLRLQRIVRARKQGRQVFYCLDDEHVIELFRLGLQHMEHE
jgi:DNA-binding transcriptional ArsR family regulator